MVNRDLQAFSGKRVLLLQGPVGPFFARLAQDLRNFNLSAGADELFAACESGQCLLVLDGLDEVPLELLPHSLGLADAARRAG